MLNFKDLIISFGAFVLPSVALAAISAQNYTPLVQLPGLSGQFDMSANGLSVYLNGLMVVLIGVAGVLAVVMLVICGVKLMGTASASAKSEAKDCIFNAIFGLLLAIGSWALLNTINPKLVASNTTPPPQDVTLALPAPSATTAAPPTKPGTWYFQYKDVGGNTKNSEHSSKDSCDQSYKNMNDSYNAGPPPKPRPLMECKEVPVVPYSGGENGVRQTLANSRIFVNKGPCPTLTVAFYTVPLGCTSVEGLNMTGYLVNTLLPAMGNNPPTCTQSALATCKLWITGGTEYGHAKAGISSHSAVDGGIGQVVDLAPTQALRDFLFNNAAKITQSFGGYKRTLYQGYWFTDEGNHLHVCRAASGGAWYCRPDDGCLVFQEGGKSCKRLGPLKQRVAPADPKYWDVCDPAKATRSSPCP